MRFFVSVICVFTSFFANATFDNQPLKFDEITATNMQPVIWQNLSSFDLPTGYPQLKKSQQINLDIEKKVSWEKVGYASVETEQLNLTATTSAFFKAFDGEVILPKWQSVKPLQYEQNTHSDIRHFSMRQGLPAGAVYQTFQDENSILWLATNGEGVCQYIVNSFRCFKKTHGLNNNRVWKIAKGFEGELLFATDKGISNFDGKSFKMLHINGEPFLEKVNDITVLNQAIFFVTDTNLYRYENGQISIVFDTLRVSKINRVTVFNNMLWLATSKGLVTFSTTNINDINSPNKDCNGNITSLTGYQNEVFFSVKRKGVCRIDLNNQSVSKLTGIFSPNITTLLVDKNNDSLWVGDDSKGVIKIQNGLAYHFSKENGLSADHIRDLMKDKQGHIWISTYSNGINRLREYSFSLLTKRNGLRNERVSALANINDQLWLGEYGGGIQVFENNQWYETEQTLKNQYVHSISQDHTERVWVGTRQGIEIFGQNTISSIGKAQGLTAEIIHKIVESPDGCIYIASSDGLYRYCQKQFQKLSLSENQYVINTLADSQNRIWFATNGGGVFYLENENVYRFTEEQGLPSNWVYSLEQGKRYFYIGTRKGVYILKENAESWLGQHIGVEIGLSSSIVLALKAVNEYLWIGTERGNNRLLIDSLFNKQQAATLKSFTYENGYLAVDSSLNSAAVKGDEIFWGSANGLTRFNPKKINIKLPLASQLLEVYSLNENEQYSYFPNVQNLNHTVEFPADTVQVTLKYAHNEWASPERVLYQTRLIGSSEIWSEPSTLSQITFNNLRPANYEFQVRAINGEQVGESVTYRFELLPPWWQTWWAYTFFLCILTALIYLVVKWQFETVRKQQRIKDRAEFSEALLARKKQLLAEVSHEIRTPLSVLKMQIEGLEYNIVDNNEKTYEVLHRRIGDINTLIADIDQLANAELQELSLNLATMLAKPWLEMWCSDAQTRIAQSEGIYFSFKINIPESTTLDADKKRLTQVLTNLLSNSIRYTQTPANIELDVSIKKGNLVISLSDSSPGVSDSDLTTIFKRMYQCENNKALYKGGTGLGLAICQDLIVRHQGEILAEHSVLGGVKVTIKLKVSD